MAPDGNDIRNCLARLWRIGPSRDNWFQLNQLAFHFFGRGAPSDAQRAGMLKALNPAFFEDHHRGKHSPIRVLWGEVQTAFPGPPWAPVLLQDSAPKRPLELALEAALDDERRHSYAHWNKHPVFVTNLRRLYSNDVRGIVYEADLEEIDEGSGGSLMEGAKVLVKPADHYGAKYGATLEKATLLLYDPLEWKMIIELAQPSSFGPHMRLAVIPDLSALIDAFKLCISSFKTHPLCHYLVHGTGSVPAPPPVATHPDGLSQEQSSFISTALSNPVTFLWGPPGTGKTFTLAALIADLALSKERVLAVAISNAAVDELAKDVYERLRTLPGGDSLLKSGSVMRFGHPGREVLALTELFPQREAAQTLVRKLQKLLEAHRKEYSAARKAGLIQEIKNCEDDLRKIVAEYLDQARVVLTTVSQAAISVPLRASQQFGTIVCDEASMANLTHIFPAASLGRHRLVIAGDPKQLGPVVIATSAAATDYLKPSLFASRAAGTISKGHPQVQLTRQRRMAPPICDLVNQAFYQGKLLSHDSVEHSKRKLALPWLSPSCHVQMIRHIGTPEKTSSGSRKNDSNADVVLRLLASLLDWASDQIDPPTIGLIAPYRAQVGLFRRFIHDLERRSGSKLERVRTGTVHAFQGGESDIIIWDLVDCQPEKPGMLYWNEEGNRLVNVAISRARKLLFIVGDDQIFRQHPGVKVTKNILYSVTSKGHLMTSDELHRKITAKARSSSQVPRVPAHR